MDEDAARVVKHLAKRIALGGVELGFDGWIRVQRASGVSLGVGAGDEKGPDDAAVVEVDAADEEVARKLPPRRLLRRIVRCDFDGDADVLDFGALEGLPRPTGSDGDLPRLDDDDDAVPLFVVPKVERDLVFAASTRRVATLGEPDGALANFCAVDDALVLADFHRP
jgi:hypothetical protein